VADAFGLDNPHVVGPDIGTSAALFAAALHPGRLRSLVIGSGVSTFPMQVTGVLKEWIEAPDLEVYRRTGSNRILTSVFASLQRYSLSDAAHEDYFSSYEGDRFVESMRYVRAYPTDLPALVDLLATIRTPVQLIAGKHDRTVPPSNAEFLHERLPSSKLAIIDSGHFTWEDAANEYGALVTAWWESFH